MGAQNGGASLKSPPRSAARSRPWVRSPLPRWLVRSTLAVAHLRLAPTSSASISATERLSPSGISQLRWRSRPVTMTRSPLPRESARCSTWAAPDVDLEEAGVAVAPLAVLLDPLGDRDAEVGDGDAVVGEAEFGVVDQVADDGGVVVGCHGAAPSRAAGGLGYPFSRPFPNSIAETFLALGQRRRAEL